jgi:hypothetical protein
MPQHERHEPASDRRRGPYETCYDVVRGYDVPPPLARRAADRAPAMVAARRESPDGSGPYG